jgi:hypothetical protein
MPRAAQPGASGARFFHFIESGYVESLRPESHQQNQVVMRIVAEAAPSYAAAGYSR